MQRIDNIQTLKANLKIFQKDKIESLAPAEPVYLYNVSNYSINNTFPFYQASSTFYK